MSIVIVAGKMEIPPENRAAALAAGKPEIEGALTQPGCLAYVWTPDPHQDNVVHVFEKWTDSQALIDHLAGPWYAGMLKVLGGHGVTNGQVSKYRVDHEEPVYDDNGKPRGDFFTG